MISLVDCETNSEYTKKLIGGKAHSLLSLKKLDLNVPKFIIITSDVFSKFLTNNNIEEIINTEIKNGLKFQNFENIEKISEKIKKYILNGKIDENFLSEIEDSIKHFNSKFFAIRSSGSEEDNDLYSWAGQFTTILNSTTKQLENNIKTCWSSFYSYRSLLYRIKRNMNFNSDKMAVIIQEMIDSEKSGVLFTVNPITKNYNEVIIEATFGLGEALVSGKVIPDMYFINKKNLEVNNRIINNKQRILLTNEIGENYYKEEDNFNESLSSDEIDSLVSNAKLIENHFNFGCDIEWAIYNKNVYILQSRKITSL